MASAPRIPMADLPLGDNDEHIVLQSGRRRRATNRQVLANVPAGAAGASAYEIAKAGGYPGTQAQWLASLKGADGAPLRVETYTAKSNTANPAIATFTFAPAFTEVLDVRVKSGWVGDQEIAGGTVTVTKTGCTVMVKRSRGSLLLSGGPFENAPSTDISIVVHGR